jgi:hypothetical protein
MLLQVSQCIVSGNQLIVVFKKVPGTTPSPLATVTIPRNLSGALSDVTKYMLNTPAGVALFPTLSNGPGVLVFLEDTLTAIITASAPISAPTGSSVTGSTVTVNVGGKSLQATASAVGSTSAAQKPTPPTASLEAGAITSAIDRVGHRVERAFGNLTKFPLMTDDVSSQVDSTPPSTGYPSAGLGGGGGTAPIGKLAARAIQSVLNWKPKDDPQGFSNALLRTFTLKEVEGHTVWTVNTPGTTTPMDVTADLSGAQRSLYVRAKDIVDAASRTAKTLYSLSATTDPQDADALTALVSDLMNQIPDELGFYGGPRPLRVDMLFDQLLGPLAFFTWPAGVPMPSPAPTAPFFGVGQLGAGGTRGSVLTDPDQIGGSLGQLRAIFGLGMNDGLVNTLDEEQNQTNYRIVADYLISLRQSWEANRGFFLSPSQQLLAGSSVQKFLGTQIVLITRQLQVVGEAVEELRFTLDSVFVGQDARSALEIDLADGSSFFLEDGLSWIYDFATDQGQRFLQEGGKLGMQTVFRPTAERLRSLAWELIKTRRLTATPVATQLFEWDGDPLSAPPPAPSFNKDIPEGFFAPRVWQSITNLHRQLDELVKLTAGITYKPTYVAGEPSPPETTIPLVS